MPKISKPFAIGTEGQTIDGRTIKREWIEQMAAKYDPRVYTANANLEHLLSLSPESLFSAYGPVLSLSTREIDILGEKKLQLVAVVKADDAVVEMQAKGKKAFPSMEVMENFASKGFAYLTGLAFTDTPASLGTETMRFSAAKNSVYSFGGDGITIEWEDDKPQDKIGETLFAKVMGLLSSKDKKADDRFADVGKAVEAVAGSQRDLLEKFAALQAELKTTGEKIAAAETAAAADREAFTALKATLDAEEANPKRPVAAGGAAGTNATDC
ncbi:MAG: GPO family capsid scaffolding protein [Rhodocyclaceae bacterium]|nr:GPO family capsid scaffolding protein [Rhodocyclaceae bacterium]